RLVRLVLVGADSPLHGGAADFLRRRRRPDASENERGRHVALTGKAANAVRCAGLPLNCDGATESALTRLGALSVVVGWAVAFSTTSVRNVTRHGRRTCPTKHVCPTPGRGTGFPTRATRGGNGAEALTW